MDKYRFGDTRGMNWQSIVSDLTSWGLTQVQIAKKCGCTQSRISDLARDGGTVSYELGVALAALHKSEARKSRAAEPKAEQGIHG